MTTSTLSAPFAVRPRRASPSVRRVFSRGGSKALFAAWSAPISLADRALAAVLLAAALFPSIALAVVIATAPAHPAAPSSLGDDGAAVHHGAHAAVLT